MTALCQLRLRPQGDLDKTEMSLRSGRGWWIGFGAARIAVANRGGEEISRNGGFGQGTTAVCAKPTAGADVKLPFAGPKTTAGKGEFQMAKPVADVLRLVAELGPPPVTSTA